MDDGPEQRRGSFVKSGAIALVLSVVANLLVRAGASALFDIPPEFPPLQGAGPVVFFSVIGVLAALGVFAGIGGVSSRPVPVFRIVAGSCSSCRSFPISGCSPSRAPRVFPVRPPPASAP